jgi:uncharacterized phage protein (TIGR01671 family)
MQRRLYRARRTDNNELVYGSPIFQDDYVLIRFWNGEEFIFEEHLVDPDSLSEHTGIKDKNGVPVFENDFIKLNDDVKELFDLRDGFVTYLGGCFIIAGNKDNFLCSLYALSDMNWVLRGEVINNKER